MSRPPRVFRPESFELEGRTLLTIRPGQLPIPTRAHPIIVGFAGPALGGDPQPVLQQDGRAEVYLHGLNYVGPHSKPVAPFQVVVDTDPSSPAVGVIVGPVHQTLTLFDSDPQPDTVVVPINPDAPNPGIVDVTLTLTPINPPPGVKVLPPMHLRILASRDYLPPEISGVTRTPQGNIAVKFSKPMDPAGATNLRNYQVTASPATGYPSLEGMGYSLENFVKTGLDSLFSQDSSPHAPAQVRIQSASYDAATDTVTLYPQRKLKAKGVTYAVSTGSLRSPLKRREHGANAGPGLIDQQGQPYPGSRYWVSKPSRPAQQAQPVDVAPAPMTIR